MVRPADTLETQLLRLPAPDRARLAELLLDSLDLPDAEGELPGEEADREEADRLWAAESVRRLDELRSGAVHAVPADEVFARLARRLAS